jgi:catechol 2,3-dioxygenase-like lactoylglutathione lyase family enzyme
MIDHVGFPVSDYERAKAFYAKALAPLGYSLVMEVTQEQTGHDPAAGFGANGKPDFWIGGEGGLNKPLHVAIVAKDRTSVDAFYRLRYRQARETTARPAFARITIRTITARSCSIPTATISRRSATRRDELICADGAYRCSNPHGTLAMPLSCGGSDSGRNFRKG